MTGTKGKCRICAKSETLVGGVCLECDDYGSWWAAVASKDSTEITGSVSVDELIRFVEKEDTTVRIVLNPAEGSGGLDLRADLLPEVSRVAPDLAGMRVEYRGADGALGEVWRPFRMGIRMIINGQPVDVLSS